MDSTLSQPLDVFEGRSPKDWIENALARVFPEGEDELLIASRYPLEAGGKRVRPLLCLLFAGMLGSENGIRRAKPAAMALEFVHTYSLVHDDLPAMDNDDLRRGKPTVHKVYGEAKGILVGDALLTEAFSLAADAGIDVVKALSRAAGVSGMVKGQWLDLSRTSERGVSWEQVCETHRYKTGALLGASCEIGAICAGVSSEIFDRAKQFGLELGLAFQIIDDILDVTSSAHHMGKSKGKDAAQNKSSAVSLLGLDGARNAAQRIHHTLNGIVQEFDAVRHNHTVGAYCMEGVRELLAQLEHRTA